jgi:hypothetical protein
MQPPMKFPITGPQLRVTEGRVLDYSDQVVHAHKYANWATANTKPRLVIVPDTLEPQVELEEAEIEGSFPQYEPKDRPLLLRLVRLYEAENYPAVLALCPDPPMNEALVYMRAAALIMMGLGGDAKKELQKIVQLDGCSLDNTLRQVVIDDRVDPKDSGSIDLKHYVGACVRRRMPNAVVPA